MKLMIGENLKKLRREREITQEELAGVLGVSCQSVSRWENGSCYPDVELLPAIAGFFGVTTDRLMGVGEAEERQFTEGNESAFREALSRGKVYECIRIAREGVREYPNNYHLLNNLMYALFIAGDDDGNIPEWRENMERFDDEIVRLGERILQCCPEQALRYEAAGCLAFQHLEMGRKREARTIFETLPDEELVQVYEKQFALDDLVWDGKHANACSRDDDYCHMAAVLARMGRADEAIEALQNAARCATAFDERPEETTCESVLCGKRTVKRTDIQMSDDRPFREIMREKWMREPDFDTLRDDPRFRAVEASLST